jgi:very-short-patch-repair endonuclease
LIHLAELDGIDDDALEEAGADLLLGFPREQARLRRQLSLFRGHGPSRVEALFGEYLEDGRRPPHPGLEKSLLAAVEHLGPVVHYRVPTPVGPLEVDLAWPDCKLAVEADSARWHSSPAHLRTDRQRDQALAMVGWTVLRFTWTQVRDQVGYVVDCITRVRAQRASG